MELRPAITTYTSQYEHEGVTYGAVARWDHASGSYHFLSIWDQTHHQYLPLDQLEEDYRGRQGQDGDTAIGSGRAVHRRLRRYILLWHERQNQEGDE